MASAASVSESMQMSIVLHGQPDVNDGPHSLLSTRTPQKGVGYCKQVMLVMTVCGMEMCMTFEQIYQVLILQYLGAPLSLVSLNGVICGLASMAIIPVVGFVTDRGSNPKRRKMVSLFVGMAAFQVGILILLVSGVIKMAALKGVMLNVDTTPPLSTPAAIVTPDAAAVYDKSFLLNITSPNDSLPDWSHINDTTTLKEHRTYEDTGLPVTAYLAICGFAFVDIGYDSTMPLSRAYILESVPKFQYIRLLVMATLVQAASGTLFSLLGVLDISEALGQAFQVDGTSAVLVFLCTLLFIAVTGGFISTTLTGYFLTKDSMYTKLQAPQINTTSKRTPETRRRKRLRSYRPHLYRTDSTDASKSPLLHDDNPAHIYAATNKIASFSASNVSFEDDHKSRRVNDSYNLHRSLSVDGKPFGDARQPAHASPVPELDESDLHGNSLLAAQNSQTSGLNHSKPPGEAATRGTETHTCQPHLNKDSVKTRMKKRLIILSASTFFTFGASISFLYYAANAVTLGIFHGDPRALPGTEGQHLYNTGLRTAAMGNLSFYILFTVTSMINSKLIEMAGDLQYLGVPLSLVSLNGVICGLASMAIIPVVGFVTDRGSNPKRRKMVSLFVGMAAFQVGILILLVSGVVKMAALKGVMLNVDTTPPLSTPAAIVTPDAAAVYDKSFLLNITSPNDSLPDWSHINDTTTLKEHRTYEDTGLPVTAYLAICGFAFVDIGYDSTMPLSRAYILESVPKFQYIRLLVMATLVQAASGTLFSLLGVLDISEALGQAFQVDGTSAVLVFLCTLLFIAVTGGFISTTLTGYFLTKDSMYTKLQAPQINTTSKRTPETRRRKRLRSYRPHLYRTDSTDASKSPLLHDDNPAHIYAATNKIASFSASNVSFEDDHKSRRVNDSYNLHRSLSVDGKPFGDARQPAHASPVPELDESDLHGNSLLAAQNSQTSGLNHSKPPGEAATRGTETPTCQPHLNKDSVKTRMKKRLIILSASTFFTFGASISFLYYAANAVTLGIFHGDPRALPGTEGQHLYNTGLRTAAMGNLSFYILFTVTSMINSKLIEIAGEKVLFIVFHLLFIIPLVALVSTRCLEAYFVTVVMVGVFRHTVYTLPFVMANKITQDTGDNITSDTGKSNLGKTMSLIGFLIPAHYIIISAIMGPVFEATSNVWVPLMYSLACACVSVLIFCLMFLVK